MVLSKFILYLLQDGCKSAVAKHEIQDPACSNEPPTLQKSDTAFLIQEALAESPWALASWSEQNVEGLNEPGRANTQAALENPGVPQLGQEPVSKVNSVLSLR